MAQSPLTVAKAYLGYDERNATQAKALSSFFQKAAGVTLNPAQTAWCAAFVNSVLATAGYQGQGTKPQPGYSTANTGYNDLWAADFLKYGTPVTTPEPGDIVVFPDHVAFVDSVNANGTINVLGGNQWTPTSPPGEGDAVNIHTDSMGSAIGFRRPVPITAEDAASQLAATGQPVPSTDSQALSYVQSASPLTSTTFPSSGWASLPGANDGFASLNFDPSLVPQSSAAAGTPPATSNNPYPTITNQQQAQDFYSSFGLPPASSAASSYPQITNQAQAANFYSGFGLQALPPSWASAPGASDGFGSTNFDPSMVAAQVPDTPYGSSALTEAQRNAILATPSASAPAPAAVPAAAASAAAPAAQTVTVNGKTATVGQVVPIGGSSYVVKDNGDGTGSLQKLNAGNQLPFGLGSATAPNTIVGGMISGAAANAAPTVMQQAQAGVGNALGQVGSLIGGGLAGLFGGSSSTPTPPANIPNTQPYGSSALTEAQRNAILGTGGGLSSVSMNSSGSPDDRSSSGAPYSWSPDSSGSFGSSVFDPSMIGGDSSSQSAPTTTKQVPYQVDNPAYMAWLSSQYQPNSSWAQLPGSQDGFGSTNFDPSMIAAQNAAGAPPPKYLTRYRTVTTPGAGLAAVGQTQAAAPAQQRGLWGIGTVSTPDALKALGASIAQMPATQQANYNQQSVQALNQGQNAYTPAGGNMLTPTTTIGGGLRNTYGDTGNPASSGPGTNAGDPGGSSGSGQGANVVAYRDGTVWRFNSDGSKVQVA